MLIGATIYGCVKTADVAWAMGDLGVGMMAWLNIIAIWILHKPALRALRDFEIQKNKKVLVIMQFIDQLQMKCQQQNSGMKIILNV